jgi:shikimate kinase
MFKSQKIYIIGFMGSGKSTAGKKLASLMGWTFVDLDKNIEEFAGKSIPEIFEQDGESSFRQIEAKILRNLNSLNHTVISTGGGTPCYNDNMEYMLGTGLTLYLKLTPGQLKSRLSKSKGERPLIKDLGQGQLLSFIEKKLADRERWYDRSDIIIEGIGLDVNMLLENVKSRLNI